jgi:hypothetical protein
MKRVKISIILTGAANPLLKKQPQVCLVEISPRIAKKIFSHAASTPEHPSQPGLRDPHAGDLDQAVAVPVERSGCRQSRAVLVPRDFCPNNCPGSAGALPRVLRRAAAPEESANSENSTGLAVHWLGLHQRARHQRHYDQHGR